VEHKFFIVYSRRDIKWKVYSTLDRDMPEGAFNHDSYIDCKNEADRRNQAIEDEAKKQLDLFN
jgi:hypothetical protein